MCGRARCTLRSDGIPRACHRTQAPVRTINMDRYRPAYNVAPGYNLPVVRRGDGSDADGYVLHCMKWGLVPSFTKKTEKPDFYRMFNARSESLSEKASFRRLLPKNRCLVAIEGFYEWKKDGSKKQPYYIHFKDDRPLVFAALYDSWESSEGEILYTFTIVTTSSSAALEWLHDRMPVILSDKESTDIWLSGSSSARFNTILKPYEKADLAWYPVTPAMGKISFDGPECIKEIQLKTEEKNPILKFFTRKGSKMEQEPNLQEKPLSDDLMKRELPKSVKEESNEQIKEEEESREEAHTTLPKIVKEEPATVGDKEESTEKIKEHSQEGHTKLPKNVKEEPDIGGDKEESTEKIKEDSWEEAHTKLPKSVKDGPAIGGDEKTHTQSHTGEEDPDAKSGLCTLHTEDKGTCLGKRDYEKLTLTKSRNQVKRKGNHKGDDDKQPTLFSYMRKK